MHVKRLYACKPGYDTIGQVDFAVQLCTNSAMKGARNAFSHGGLVMVHRTSGSPAGAVCCAPAGHVGNKDTGHVATRSAVANL